MPEDERDRASSRSSRGRARPRSETRRSSARRASSPTWTRSRRCTTAATSTRRWRASAPGRTATSAGSRSSSSTSTTSRRRTTGSATWRGDAVLAAVAERLLSAVRQADIACRVGGDEFAVILPEAGAARRRAALPSASSSPSARGAAGPAERVRLSAGIAELRPEDDAISLFERADEALYRAKEGGKGQVQPGGRLEPAADREHGALEAQAGRRRARSCSRRLTRHADVLEKAGAVRLQLVGEEVPRRCRSHLLLCVRTLGFVGTSHVTPHLAVDPVDNLPPRPAANAASALFAAIGGPVYASACGDCDTPFEGCPEKSSQRARKTRSGRATPARAPRTRARARPRRPQLGLEVVLAYR